MTSQERKEKKETTMKPQDNYHIEGRRWFQRTYGNTYHSVRILKNGKQIAYLGPTYGYGNHYMQTAFAWLSENGIVPRELDYGNWTWDKRQELHMSSSVADVGRQKDL